MARAESAVESFKRIKQPEIDFAARKGRSQTNNKRLWLVGLKFTGQQLKFKQGNMVFKISKSSMLIDFVIH